MNQIIKKDKYLIEDEDNHLTMDNKYLRETNDDNVFCECGAKQKPGACFCTKCGRPLKTIAPDPPIDNPRPTEGERVCGSCGKKLKPGARFCVYCRWEVPTDKPDGPIVRVSPRAHPASGSMHPVFRNPPSLERKPEDKPVIPSLEATFDTTLPERPSAPEPAFQPTQPAEDLPENAAAPATDNTSVVDDLDLTADELAGETPTNVYLVPDIEGEE